MSKKRITGAETKLEKAVQAMINRNSDGNPATWLNDLAQGGCQSGIVGELIYYTDTVKFYQTHRAEIKSMLREMIKDCGCTIEELFRNKWDAEDMFAEEENNQNLLAWFGFEETARILADRNGIEI